MPEFTQGKWIYNEPFGVIFSDETCAVIANVQGAGTGSCFCLTQEGQANARLIACAPEMYRTLVKILDDTQNGQFASESEIIALLDRIAGKNTGHEQ